MYLLKDHATIMIKMRRMESQMYDNLETITYDYPQALLYIAGDLNSRCKDFLDYIPFDDLFYIFW